MERNIRSYEDDAAYISNCLMQMFQWVELGVSHFPGVISLAAGLLMWMTSLHPVRKKKFELFFYAHQLYVIFIVFLALHVGHFLFCVSVGGIFLFILDRFLRFCQSRKTIDIISIKCLSCGTVELVLSKPASNTNSPQICSFLVSTLLP